MPDMIRRNALFAASLAAFWAATPLMAAGQAAINDLEVTAGATTHYSITLLWSAPDDNAGPIKPPGEVARPVYDLRYSTSDPASFHNLTDWWDAATPVYDEPVVGEPGSTDTMTVYDLSPETTYFFAIQVTGGDAPNISNIASGATLAAPVPTPTPTPPPVSVGGSDSGGGGCSGSSIGGSRATLASLSAILLTIRGVW